MFKNYCIIANLDNKKTAYIIIAGEGYANQYFNHYKNCGDINRVLNFPGIQSIGVSDEVQKFETIKLISCESLGSQE